jgi:hypothetical protein
LIQIYQDFQYFLSLPTLRFLQAVLVFFIEIGTIFMNILYNTH